MADNHYDVIIIGSGAGGGTLAWKLAPTGKRILLIERGQYVAREKDNWDSKKVILESKYHIAEEWFDRDGQGFHAGAHYNVGGNTKFYGAALLRMREKDFGEVAHKGGISPKWPISYAELEPYYTQAEHLYFVHGERGADPTEPRASAGYKYPAMSHEPRMQQLSDDLAKLGLKPFHLPVGVMIDEQNPHKSRCIRCNTCDGFPCMVNAKADAQVVCVDPALEHPNVSMITGALVTKLETSASGREIAAVQVNTNGVVERMTGGIVVVSAGAINSAALLLKSANDKHPKGLANGSDEVGRNYMAHVNSMMLAISTRPNPTVFQKTLAINDFYFGAPGFEHPMGHISFVGKSDEYMLAAGAPKLVPGLTLDVMAKHSIDFWMTTEDLPDPRNRVTLTEDGSIRLEYQANNLEAHGMLQKKLESMLEHIGCERHLLPHNFYVGKRIPLAGVAHQNGTVRFGADPKTSVLDTDCRAHEVDNLYVVDGSFFPSSSAVNPALTIMANALRVGDHLTSRLG